MRFAIISDIHANLPALQKTLKAIEQLRVQHIFCLGDIVGYGTEPQGVIDIIRTHKIPTVMGNHDETAMNPELAYYMNPFAQAAINQHIRILPPDDIRFLESLPKYIKKDKLHLVHGIPPASNWEYIHFQDEQELEQIFESFDAQIAFVGHTHLFRYYEKMPESTVKTHNTLPKTLELQRNTKYVINCGTVGEPRPPENKAGFIIYDNERSIVQPFYF